MTAYDDVIKYWRNKKVINSAALDVVVNGLAINLAYHTTHIEVPTVTYHDTREIFENGRVTGYTGSVKDLFSLQNAKYGWDALLDSFEKRLPLDESLIKMFHRTLTEGTYDEKRYISGERPGHYKIGDFVTGRYEIGALAEDVPEEMDELVNDICELPSNETSVEKILTTAAFFHAKFENIHPFADGNGRTGRLLMNYLLVLYDHPVIIIHEEDRRDYMGALEDWDRDQKLDGLISFLKEQTVKTWEARIKK